ncbi:hypothetical protein [Planktotalea sp.]|uniref:hypothetical protein n=1 Tax=Planktotalea sp. TaxID=2029877 RepID=UPI003D6A967A
MNMEKISNLFGVRTLSVVFCTIAFSGAAFAQEARICEDIHDLRASYERPNSGVPNDNPTAGVLVLNRLTN